MLEFEITLKINIFEITILISNPNPNSNPSSQMHPYKIKRRGGYIG